MGVNVVLIVETYTCYGKRVIFCRKLCVLGRKWIMKEEISEETGAGKRSQKNKINVCLIAEKYDCYPSDNSRDI